MSKNIQGNRIIKLFNNGLDTEPAVENVDRIYQAAESAMMSDKLDTATQLCQKVLKLLQEASARVPGDLAVPYSSGKCHLLLASIYLNQDQLQKAERHFIQSKHAFGSRKWLHLEGLAYLGLALTHQEIARTQPGSENLGFAIDACYRAQNSLAQEAMPPTINTAALAQTIKTEIIRVEELIKEGDQTVALKVFSLSAGAGLTTIGGTTDLNLISRNDYEYNASSRPLEVTIDLEKCRRAQYVDYVLEIDAEIDGVENGLHKGDWLLIRDEKDHIAELNGRQVVVLMNEGPALWAGLKTFSQAEDHYFLKAHNKSSDSVIIVPYRSETLARINDYYKGYERLKKRYAYEVQVSGEVIEHIPRASIKKITSPIIWRIPILSEIAAGVGETIDEEYVEDYRDFSGKDGFHEADFGVRVKGDSMSGDNIFDGNIALIRQQPTAAPGDIAAVVIVRDKQERRGVLKRYYVVQEQNADLRHWLLESSNPSSEHLVVMPHGADEKAIKQLYTRGVETGTIVPPKYYKNAKMAIAGKYVGLVQQD